MEEKTLKKIGAFLNRWEEKEIFKEIEEFHQERIVKLKNNETPKPFREGGKIVLHLIPKDSFREDPTYYDIFTFEDKSRVLLKPFFEEKEAFSQTYNFEGLLNFLLAEDKTSLSYVQLYRNGIIEAVEGVYFAREKKDIPIYKIEQEIMLKTDIYLSFQNEIGIKLPIVCYLALLGAKGYKIPSDSIRNDFLDIHPFDVEDLHLPKIIIDKPGVDTKKMFKISFDRIWNTCGYPRSFQYNENGEFTLKR